MEEIDCIKLAIVEAGNCRPKDPMTTPKVGAVIVDSGGFVAYAHRVEDDHAEKILLDRARGVCKFDEATLYTTLEPCTQDVRRGHLDSCADRIVQAGVNRVMVGMLDPNQGVCGKGVLRLQDARIEVQLFPQPFAQQVKDLNLEFDRAQRGFGIRIGNPLPNKPVRGGKIQLSGTYINFPSPNDCVIAIVRQGNRWWPQGRITDLGGGKWKCSTIVGSKGPDHSIYIVRAHSSGITLVHYYWKMGNTNRELEERMRAHLKDAKFTCPWPESDYPPIVMETLPKGLDAEDRVDIEIT
jgi:pyrimidine deaminase RibD-like protein